MPAAVVRVSNSRFDPHKDGHRVHMAAFATKIGDVPAFLPLHRLEPETEELAPPQATPISIGDRVVVCALAARGGQAVARGDLAFSRSGSAKTRLGGFFRDLVFGIGDGLLSVADSFTGYSLLRRL
jgi:hypothetical protein